MATENSPPKIRIILTVAFSSIVILVTLNYVFRSYFLMMTEDVEHQHQAVPVELNKLHEGEQRNLTTAPLSIENAMKALAQHGREGSDALKQYADVTPEASNDMGPMVGWIQNPNQAVIDAMNAADDADAGAQAAPAPTAGDGGVSNTDGGAIRAAGALDAGAAHPAPKVGTLKATRDAGPH